MADRVDERIWRVVGTPLVAGSGAGPLAGRTVAVKDLFDVAGHAVGAGNPAYLAERAPARASAPAVAALLAAGADVRGLARTDEFAYSIAGRNPHDGTPPNAAVPGALPGGSSSGPACAVAWGQADVGLATDTAGSVRVPASYQGLWGLRPTHGRVSTEGLLPLAPSFDTVGWLTRDAATLRAAAAATFADRRARGTWDGPDAVVGGFVVAPALLEGVDPSVRAAFDAAVERLGEVGTVDLPAPPGELFETFRVVQAAEAWAAHGAWVEAHPGAVGPGVAERFAVAAALTPQEVATARSRLAEHRTALDAALGTRVLVVPSASSAAPSATAPEADVEATRVATLRLCCVAGITGRPGLGVPALQVPGPFGGDAPVGLCLVGPRGSDLALVDRAVQHV